MKTIIHHGRPSVHRHRGVGSHVEIHMHAEGAGEWSGVYKLSSHGMTAEAFASRVAELKAYHAAKMNRLKDFELLRAADIFVDGVKHRITDANLIECGVDVELRLGVSIIGAGGGVLRAFTMGRQNGLIYPSIAAVPSDAEIVRIVRWRIEALVLGGAAHDAFLSRIAAMAAEA